MFSLQQWPGCWRQRAAGQFGQAAPGPVAALAVQVFQHGYEFVPGPAAQEPLDGLPGLVGGVQVMSDINERQVSVPFHLPLDEGQTLAGSGHRHAFAFGEQVSPLGERVQAAAAGDQPFA